LGFTIVSFGEALWDLLPSGPILGGAPLNFAYRANSLGNRGVIVSRLGRDGLGQKAAEQIVALGMEGTFLQWDEEHPTGTVEIHFDAAKNPNYTIIAGVAYDHIEFIDRLSDLISGADCLCFGTLAQRNAVSQKTLRRLLDEFSGNYSLLDINLRKNCYSQETILSSLERANIAKLNEEELHEVAGLYGLKQESLPEMTRSLLCKAELEYCVVTLGAKGAFAVSREGENVYHPGFEIKLTDPCGAGDGFAAGFIHSLLNKDSLAQACRFGNALGAMVAQQEGATQVITYREITAFMEKASHDIVLEDFKSFHI
jgi:fructokinase